MADRDGPWIAVCVDPSKFCAKTGGGDCEGSPHWWVADRSRNVDRMDGPNCEKHAKSLAAKFNAIERGEIPDV